MHSELKRIVVYWKLFCVNYIMVHTADADAKSESVLLEWAPIALCFRLWFGVPRECRFFARIFPYDRRKPNWPMINYICLCFNVKYSILKIKISWGACWTYLGSWFMCKESLVLPVDLYNDLGFSCTFMWRLNNKRNFRIRTISIFFMIKRYCHRTFYLQ